MTITNKASFTFNSYDVVALSNNEWTQDVNKHVIKYSQLKEVEVIDTKEVDTLIANGYNFWITVVNDKPYFNNDCYLVDLYLSYINKPISVYINKAYFNMITGQEAEVVEQTEVIETIESPVTIVTNNETTYTVGNTSFNTLHEAQAYCDNNDFEYELIQEIGNTNNTKQTNVTPVYWYEYKLRGFSIGCQPKGFIEHNDTIGRHGIIAYDRLLTDIELDEYDLRLHSASYKVA